MVRRTAALDYVIGCDVGSQSAKALLLSVEGNVVGEASEYYTIDHPHPLWAEQPAERWTTALTAAIRRLLNDSQIDPARVRALGVAAQVDSVVPVDAAGQPLHPAIIWMDRRAEAQTKAANRLVESDDVFDFTGLNLDAAHAAPKIRWLMDTDPQRAARTRHYLLPGSYIGLYLTGEVAVDYSNASSTLLMDVTRRDWAEAMCRPFGIDSGKLAPIRPPTTRLGGLKPPIAESLGLRPGTLVVVGGGSQHAACLGAGVVVAGLAADIAGAAEPVCTSSPQPVFDPTRLLETHSHADPDLWLLANPGFVSGGNLRWYRDQFGLLELDAAIQRGLSAYQYLDACAATIAPGSDGIIFLPCLMGAMAPTWNPSARGVFFGFTLAHTRDHFTRAVLEGSAYAVRDIIDQMQTIGLGLKEIRAMGGAARSRLWNQIKADVTGLPVTVPAVTETTALGAAMLALVGLGVHRSPAEAASRIVRVADRYEPRPAAQSVYAERYAQYRQLYFSMLPNFRGQA